MARSAATVWEVRTTGSDTNGGGFKAGASGTDYSQQNAAQIAVTDGVTNGTTTITSATVNFSAAHIGNLVYVSGGTGSVTADRYEITAVPDAQTITVDRSTGLTAGTGVTLNVGGALASPVELANFTRGIGFSNKAWVKNGTYSITATLTFAATGTVTSAAPPTQIIGYATTRGDITETSANQSSRPTIQVDAALGAAAVSSTGIGNHIRHFILADGTGSFTNGFSSGQTNSLLHNCKVSDHSTNGINYTGATSLVEFCEVTGGTGASAGIVVSSSAAVERCYVHDTPGIGITHNGSGDVLFCIVDTMTSATSDGIVLGGSGARALFNTVYNCGRHGINHTGGAASVNWAERIKGNILANNGGYGLTRSSGAGLPASVDWDGNAFYSNTSGTRDNHDDTGSANAVNALGPYTNAYDVTLTASPFTDAANADFTLNNTAGGGAACRGVAPMHRWPGLSAASYRDMGAIQHQDAGGSGTVFVPGGGTFSHIREH